VVFANIPLEVEGVVGDPDIVVSPEFLATTVPSVPKFGFGVTGPFFNFCNREMVA